MDNTHMFTIRGFSFLVIIREKWIEYKITAPNGEWRKFFKSKAGYNGDIKEIMVLGEELLVKAEAA